mmetsp:Transcript_7813/g.20285  ORF Transcript_7813/g.20285 Transcript_7813/m.20285 type:complete len:263 (+) Transcript_7813:270-1058(+)
MRNAESLAASCVMLALLVTSKWKLLQYLNPVCQAVRSRIFSAILRLFILWRKRRLAHTCNRVAHHLRVCPLSLQQSVQTHVHTMYARVCTNQDAGSEWMLEDAAYQHPVVQLIAGENIGRNGAMVLSMHVGGWEYLPSLAQHIAHSRGTRQSLPTLLVAKFPHSSYFGTILERCRSALLRAAESDCTSRVSIVYRKKGESLVRMLREHLATGGVVGMLPDQHAKRDYIKGVRKIGRSCLACSANGASGRRCSAKQSKYRKGG